MTTKLTEDQRAELLASNCSRDTVEAVLALVAEPSHTSLRVGDMLYGFCGGLFGRDSYENKRVEAIGHDWVVARETGYYDKEDRFVVFASVDHEQHWRLLEQARTETT